MAAIKEDNVVRLKLINYDHPGEAGTVLTSQRTHSVGGGGGGLQPLMGSFGLTFLDQL